MRRLIGYRVVRERDGVREYEHAIYIDKWTDDARFALTFSSQENARRSAMDHRAKCVPVYLTVRRRRK